MMDNENFRHIGLQLCSVCDPEISRTDSVLTWHNKWYIVVHYSSTTPKKHDGITLVILWKAWAAARSDWTSKRSWILEVLVQHQVYVPLQCRSHLAEVNIACVHEKTTVLYDMINRLDILVLRI